MTANFNALGEKLGLNEETQALIQEEWKNKLSEAREEIAAELREEFAQKFTHDKQLVIESVDKFLTEQLKAEIEELAEDKQKLAAERVKYKTQIQEHIKVLDQFVMKQVAKELKEHRAERVEFKKGVETLENFVLTQLAEEIKEFHGDKKALQEQRVQVVREARKEIAEAKAKFVSRAAEVIEESIDRTLRNEISQFKEDITIARENDFGRRVFESVVAEYAASYLNENSEVKKLRKVIESKEQEIQQANDKLVGVMKKEKMLESKLAASRDQIVREKKMQSLLGPLGKEKARVMHDLLESVQTSDLDKAYKKYLPAVLNESKVVPSRGKKVLTEDVDTDIKSEKTGDRAANAAQTTNEDDDTSLDKLMRLAGIQ